MYLDIFLSYLYRKTEKNETKEKFGHFAECISQNTRQSGLHRVSRKTSLPSAKLLALGKSLTVCRVLTLALGKQMRLCRVLWSSTPVKSRYPEYSPGEVLQRYLPCACGLVCDR